jgi:DNA-binding transcriptional MerR regulator
MLSVSGELSIQQASLLLNVPAPTIRSWERRYGLPVVDRSTGGHRRYTSNQLQMLRRIRDEIASGRPARAAAARVTAAQSSPSDPKIEAFLASVHQLDSTTLSQLLDSFTQTLGLARMLDEVLFPAMREVGRWWETGRCDVAHEHLATETSRAWLSRATQAQPAVRPQPEPILLTCGPRDYHTIGLESLGALLSQRGWPCRMLGARTPAESLPIAVTATNAAAVILVSHLPSARRSAIESLRGIRRSNVHLFYAGNAFLSAQARRSVPGTYLGINISQAADLILTHITAEQPLTNQDSSTP